MPRLVGQRPVEARVRPDSRVSPRRAPPAAIERGSGERLPTNVCRIVISGWADVKEKEIRRANPSADHPPRDHTKDKER